MTKKINIAETKVLQGNTRAIARHRNATFGIINEPTEGPHGKGHRRCALDEASCRIVLAFVHILGALMQDLLRKSLLQCVSPLLA